MRLFLYTPQIWIFLTHNNQKSIWPKKKIFVSVNYVFSPIRPKCMTLTESKTWFFRRFRISLSATEPSMYACLPALPARNVLLTMSCRERTRVLYLSILLLFTVFGCNVCLMLCCDGAVCCLYFFFILCSCMLCCVFFFYSPTGLLALCGTHELIPNDILLCTSSPRCSSNKTARKHILNGKFVRKIESVVVFDAQVFKRHTKRQTQKERTFACSISP